MKSIWVWFLLSQEIYYFVKKDNDHATYTYKSGFASPFVDPVQLINMLNGLGSQGCRIITFEYRYTGKHPDILNGGENQPKIATCVNSSAHNGTYSYRYYDYPTGPNPTARSIALQNLINQQAQQGYRLVSKSLDMSDRVKNGILFMRDSENLEVGEFKVFAEGAFSNKPLNNYLIKRLEQQAQLGWLLTSGEIIYATQPHALQTDLADIQYTH